MDEGSLSLPPFTGHDEKSQRNYHLALRGNSLNPMIDAATPLLGMVMRLSTMNRNQRRTANRALPAELCRCPGFAFRRR